MTQPPAPDNDLQSSSGLEADPTEHHATLTTGTTTESNPVAAGAIDAFAAEAAGPPSDATGDGTTGDPFLFEMPPQPEPYEFDPKRLDEVALVLDASASNLDLALYALAADVSSSLEASGPALGDALRREIIHTLHYRLRVEHGLVSTAGARLEPAATSDATFQFPTPIDRVSDDVVALWEELAGSVTAPIVAALLHDLLFTRKRTPVGQHAMDAIDNYLDAAANRSDLHTQTSCLLRAWTLARQTRSASRESAVRAAMWSAVIAQLNLPGGGAPGVTLPLLSALSQPATVAGAAVPGEPNLDDALETASRLYTSDHLVDQVVELQTRRAKADPVRLTALARRRVQARLEAANAAVGHLRLFHLEQVAALARDLGITDLADQAVAGIQAIPAGSLEWISMPRSVSIPRHVIEGYLAMFDHDPDWRVGMGHWLATPPPSGNYPANRRGAEERSKTSVFRKIMPTKAFASHGLPERSIGTEDEEIIEHDVRDSEAHLARIHGAMLADGLDRIRDLRPGLHPEIVAEWIGQQYGCDPNLARRLARAIRYFWDGDYDACGHVIAPAVESAVRGLLRELNEPLYRVEQGRKIGQFPGLGALLPDLEREGFDPDWVRFIQVLLLPEGRNLRNLIAHGFVDEIGRIDATLLLRAAAVVVLLAAPDAASRDADDIRGSLRNPVSPPRRRLRRRLRDSWGAARREFLRDRPS